MVVLGCVEKIESVDGQRIGFEREEIFFVYWVLEKKKNKTNFVLFCFVLFFFFNDYRGLEKKNQNFCIFFLNDADMENCGASKDFDYIYIYIYRLD